MGLKRERVKEIKRLCRALKTIWLQSPELRLGQLIVNVANLAEPCPGVFYKSDKDMEFLMTTWFWTRQNPYPSPVDTQSFSKGTFKPNAKNRGLK